MFYVGAAIGMRQQGVYAAGTTYFPNDLVQYLGTIYMATSVTTGNTPTNTSYWAPVVATGTTYVPSSKWGMD